MNSYIIEDMQIPYIDEKIFGLLLQIHTTFFDYIFATITYSAGYMVVTLVSILTILAFVLHKHAKRIKPFIIALAGTTASVYLLKLIFGLKRPEYAVYIESSPSFPSGHAATAMVLYGFLLLTAWKHDKHHLKNPLIFGLAILILLVGLSRLYLGVHYFADVAAGYLIGLIWLLLANNFYKKAI
jgi:undecaprenyl-diphosphatase